MPNAYSFWIARMFWLYVNVCFIVCACSATRAEVAIDSDGGYKNLVVGINPDVPESKIKTVLFELENLFKNASSFLHAATRKQTFFKEVLFAVPKRYRSALPGLDWITEFHSFKHPEVMVTSEDVFSNPYTLQHKGCGKQGLRIHLPEEFLLGTNTNKAKALVQEWAQYRYGIFEENGFIGDELYPACYKVPGSDTVKIVDCTNKEAAYDTRISPEQFPLACKPVPILKKNNHLVSSLMNKMDFPQVNQFCDDELYPHNKNAPSKQNTLCRKQSTWKIISRHHDFRLKLKKNSKPVAETTFKYVIEPDIRLILAVDTSNKMAENDRLDMVQNAFSYFTLYNLPENSMVGLKNLKTQQKNPVLVTVNTPADAEILIDAFPETDGEGEVCVQCGIEEALQVLKVNSPNPQGQIVVISATDIPEMHVKSLESALNQSDVTLHVLYFNNRLKEPPLLQKLSTISGGRFQYIPDNAGSLTLLYEAFRSLYESFSWMNRNHVLVNQKTFSYDSSSTCKVSFQTDQSMDNFQVLLTGPRFFDGPPVVKDKTVLSNGNQEFAPGHSSYSYKRKIPAYVFSIKNPKPGTWSLSFERKPGFYKPLVVIVRSSARKHNSIAHMNSWISHNDNIIKGYELQKPSIALYSEVKMHHFPVANVSVSAILYKPDSGEEITLSLFDGGDGDPDITRNDGIFSKYFTEANKHGYYLITMIAESKYDENQLKNFTQGDKEEYCCGSSFPSSAAYDLAPFQRVVTLGSFYVGPEDVGLSFPPRRISDLRVNAMRPLKSPEVGYELKWTSPGDNYDSGIVADYHLRVFRDPADAEENFDTGYILNVDDFNIHGQMLTRNNSVAGSVQRAIVELRNLSSGTYYFAMRSVNSVGKFSDISNVVEIWYNLPIIPFTNDPFTGIDDTSISFITSTDSNPENKPLTLASGLGLALGLTLGILLFFIFCGCILYLYFVRFRKKNKVHHRNKVDALTIEHSFLKDISQKSESCDVLCQNTNAVNVSVISPVNSWPANSLISHYESLKRDKNSDFSEDSNAPKDVLDTVSISSSKYSYVNRIDRNSSVYDPIYFSVQDRDDNINYPYNPGYAPFNPICTSSLRQLDEDGRVPNGYSPSCSILDTSKLERQGSLNPIYASSLPRPHAFNRILSDHSSSCSYNSLNGRRIQRLGTDV